MPSLITRIAAALVLGVGVAVLPAAEPVAEPVADTVYYNGKIITLWDDVATTEALAVSGNRFLAVGTNDEVLATAGRDTTKIDLNGKSIGSARGRDTRGPGA